MRRKILSLLLAAAMVFSLSVTVHAEETEEKTMDGRQGGGAEGRL